MTSKPQFTLKDVYDEADLCRNDGVDDMADLLAWAGDEIERLQQLEQSYESALRGEQGVTLPDGTVWIGRPFETSQKLKDDTGGGCSICAALPVVNVHGSYWLCGPCVLERLPDETPTPSGESPNEFQAPSTLGYSYEDVRSMSDELIVEVGLKCGDRLAAELANRYDVVCEKITADETDAGLLEMKLPCDVKLPPNTVVGRGCTLQTLLFALRTRQDAVDKGEVLPRFIDLPAEICRHVDAKANAIKHGCDSVLCSCGTLVTAVKTGVSLGFCGLHSWGAPPGQDDLPCPYCAARRTGD